VPQTQIEKILREKVALLESAPSLFETSIASEEKQILKRLLKQIGGLDTEDGKFVASIDNLNRLDKIAKDLKASMLKGDYVNIVSTFIKSFDESASLTDDYLKLLVKGYKPSKVAKEFLLRNKKAALEHLIGTPLDTEFIKPIASLLEDAMASGAGWIETIKDIELFIEGSSKRHGKLQRYTKQIVSDSLSITDSVYTQVTTQELNMQWFLYTGGLIKDSRCFCRIRNNGYYHKKEIEAWGAGNVLAGGIEENCGFPWGGMIPETNAQTIFIFRGGYNCKHAIMPVSIFIVPKDVVKRNMANGNYTPSAFEVKELNL
jgi:hypothetical protein